MAKTILLSPRAQKEYKLLSTTLQKRVKKALIELSDGSKRMDIKKLKGVDDREDLYRLRVGSYRIIYGINKNVIEVARIEHRGKGYGWLD